MASVLDQNQSSFYWYAEFRLGRTSIEDTEQSGRLKEAVIPEIIRRILLNDRKVKGNQMGQYFQFCTNICR